jgi:hypothetical protein
MVVHRRDDPVQVGRHGAEVGAPARPAGVVAASSF